MWHSVPRFLVFACHALASLTTGARLLSLDACYDGHCGNLNYDCLFDRRHRRRRCSSQDKECLGR